MPSAGSSLSRWVSVCSGCCPGVPRSRLPRLPRRIRPSSSPHTDRAVFEDFSLERVDCGDVTLRVRHGGSGPPVVLVHGHPRTHATWHRVAALLADRHTVVCPDLRGYGGSTGPPPGPHPPPAAQRPTAGGIAAP